MNAYLHSLCTQFLVELNRSVSDSNIVSARFSGSPLEKITSYIWENFSHRLSLGQTAEYFLSGPATVEKLFAVAGKSFNQYVVECLHRNRAIYDRPGNLPAQRHFQP